MSINKKFTACNVEDGDEIFRNGIFEFNVTKLILFIYDNPDKVTLEQVSVTDYHQSFATINESHIDSVDINNPIIFAEIAPGKYNLIDGNHRMEKARRLGEKTISAFMLTAVQHINFLTSEKAYLAYVPYWNYKLKSSSR